MTTISSEPTDSHAQTYTETHLECTERHKHVVRTTRREDNCERQREQNESRVIASTKFICFIK